MRVQPLWFLVVMERNFSVIRGWKRLTPPEPLATLNEKYIVAHDKPHDSRFIIPEPVSSRTRRKLQLDKHDGKQVTLSAEVYSEMEPSSNDEEAEVQVASERSCIQAICSGERELVSREHACGMSWGSATLCTLMIAFIVRVYIECAAGTYGPNCSLRCQCRDSSDCHPVSGQCICAAGWTGLACQHSTFN